MTHIILCPLCYLTRDMTDMLGQTIAMIDFIRVWEDERWQCDASQTIH